MAQNEKDEVAGHALGADSKPSGAEHIEKDGPAHVNPNADEEIFETPHEPRALFDGAPIPASPSQSDTVDPLSEAERFGAGSPPRGPFAHEAGGAASLPPEPPSAPPPRKKSGFWRKLTLTVAALGLLAAIGGLAAIQFKDKDQRLRAVADFIEQTEKDAKALFQSLEQKITALLPKDELPNKSIASKTRPPETSPTAPKSVEPKGVETAPARDANANSGKRETAQPATPPARLIDEAASQREENARALSRRVELLEEQVRAATRSAQEAQTSAQAAAQAAQTAAQAAGKSAEAGAKPTATSEEGTYLNALEGRIDELAEEIKAVRDRLNSPKNETRLEPEPAQSHPPAPEPPKASGTAGELVVVAQALMQEIEKGRPYAIEQSALTSLGADPALLAMLAPTAESGAPTAAQLRETFAPVAKRLRALEQPATDGTFTDRLLTGVKKLVKVRRKDQPPVDIIDETVTKIDAALRHNDLDAAVSAFETLPDNAKEEAKGFGEALIHRRDAEKAAASLLTGAIAALGHAKN